MYVGVKTPVRSLLQSVFPQMRFIPLFFMVPIVIKADNDGKYIILQLLPEQEERRSLLTRKLVPVTTV